jgi:glycosyltransferase involved in cell wall biosynthesis
LELTSHTRIAVLVPCLNEGASIGSVVGAFKGAIPECEIYVFDNNSTDDTAHIASQAGAHVRTVNAAGKGHVVRRMFADIDADIYLMVDGDATYDASAAPAMVRQLIDEGLDMVVACRIETEQNVYRRGHRLGNSLLTSCVSFVFGNTFTDMLSGYRVFSRRYVKSFPANSTGFEIETELTVHALEQSMPVAETQTHYFARPEGSESKLRTYRDGVRILLTIARLFETEKPFAFFSILAILCTASSLLLALPILGTYLETGLVPRLPTAVLCAALVLLATILLVCGIILDSVSSGRREAKRLAYLSIPGIGRSGAR